MVAGYRWTARLAEERRLQAESRGDKHEEKEWRHIRDYADMMANCRYVDAPESRVNYMPFDDRFQEKGAISKALTDIEEGDSRFTDTQKLAGVVGVGLLSPGQRNVTRAFYGDLLKREEVAGMTGLSTATVDVHLREARVKWRRLRTVSELLK